jgi:hypothetical protein
MRLSLKVNGNPRVVAAVNGPGYLSAHLNLCERPKDNDYSKTVRVVGIQTLETETVRLEWPELVLQVGDTAELSLPERWRRRSAQYRPKIVRIATEFILTSRTRKGGIVGGFGF